MEQTNEDDPAGCFAHLEYLSSISLKTVRSDDSKLIRNVSSTVLLEQYRLNESDSPLRMKLGCASMSREFNNISVNDRNDCTVVV